MMMKFCSAVALGASEAPQILTHDKKSRVLLFSESVFGFELMQVLLLITYYASKIKFCSFLFEQKKESVTIMPEVRASIPF